MWPRSVAELIRGLVDLLYPGRCLVCDADDPDGPSSRHGLCSSCHAAVTTDPHDTCSRCAATVGPHVDTSVGCPACQPHAPKFDHAVRLGPYDGLLRVAILRLKSLNGDGLAEMLGRMHADARGDALRDVKPTVVVPIPLHWRRRLARGYNQSDAIGREVAAALGIPFARSWLRRSGAAVQHEQPSASARRENVRGAFSLGRRASPSGQTVLLVDDVMTTGATLSEAAGVLKVAGAVTVVAAVLARR